jgi:lipoprotein NlpD
MMINTLDERPRFAMRANSHGLAVLAAVCAAFLLAACSTTTPAPIVDRSARPATTDPRAFPSTPLPPVPSGTAPSGVITGAAPPATIIERSAPPSTVGGAQPGNTPGSAFHVVQKGETLYRIAVNNGLNVDALAAWNNMIAGQPIREGQVLRLRPPDGATTSVTPISPGAAPGTPGAPLIVQPDIVPPTPVAPLKSEPRAQRVPYSDSALAQMQRSDAPVLPPSTSGTTAPNPAASSPSAAGSSASAGASPSTATAVQPLAGEPEIRPGNGVDRDGVAWTWPTTGRLASRFNERAPMKGVDIATKVGTPVVAAAAGKVIYVGKEPRGFGQMIVVSHAKETVSVYFHTDKVQVKEQQRVTLGQRMAEVSESPESKMHFEVRRQGRPLDPVALMPSR